MIGKYRKTWSISLCLLVLLPVHSWAQNVNASLSGTVTDPSGAVVPDAQLTVTGAETGAVTKTTTGPDGLYSFPNLRPGTYDVKVSAKSFRDFLQRGIRLTLREGARLDIKLEIGAESQTVEVQADASPLNYDTAEQKGGISPQTLGELPLLVGGGVRSSASFVTLLPGVTTPTGNVLDAHINGAQQYAGESLLNGVSLVNPSGGNGIWSAAFDFAQSPDMVSELKVLTADYEPQYGSTGGAVVIMETKQGTNQFHGGAYWFYRERALNAKQYGATDKAFDIQNNFGGAIGGPVKIPGAWAARNKTYFFFNYEGLRLGGGVTRPTLSIPTMQERNGDFRDWVDSDGNLIPIYDPATTRTVNGETVRDQFMGCDGHTPNVICSNRIQNSLANQWFKFLPEPNLPGVLNNYLSPGVPNNYNSILNLINVRVDQFLGNNDHFTLTLYHRDQPLYTGNTTLPPQISPDRVTFKHTWINRLNWDHTFSPTLLNHFAGGYDDDFYAGGSVAGPYADQLPQISGAANHAYPPTIYLGGGFTQYGNPSGFADQNPWPAPAYIVNDLVTWVKGKHTFKMGGEYRNAANTYVTAAGEAGQFTFDSPQTSVRGITSGSPIASFLLEQVNTGTVSFLPYGLASARWDAWIAHFGDTWKVTPKLTLNLGIRWEMHRPTAERHDIFSFLDPYGANPGAGGRPGRLVFAGTEWGADSYGARRPEETFKTGFGPRVGIAYSPDPKMVIRTGYGIFYDAAYYPGWGGGLAQDGFNARDHAFLSTQGGLGAAFILSEGLPTDFQHPPFLDSTYLNGQPGPLYRPIDANRLPYSQQWNLSIERQFTDNFYVTASYVGSKGTRLISRTAPLNALNPNLLSMGNQLYDEFQPGQSSLDGVPLPYSGWVEQMQAGCGSASVAQALLPYPQYCGALQGLNENAGNSTFHSFQLKAEKRFSDGFWALGSYTLAKLLTNADSNQPGDLRVSPFERNRTKGLALEDVPQTLTVSLLYELPIGKGKRWLSNGGISNMVLGGWTVSTVFRASSGIPFTFTSGTCNVPGQFQAACFPAILPGANPFAQDKSNFDPNKPLLNVAAFQDPNTFNFYLGDGPRVSNVRGFGYHNQDFTILKNFHITETVTFQIRGDVFNLWNWHSFRSFDTDLASPTFGMWTGTVTPPRYIQIGTRILF